MNKNIDLGHLLITDSSNLTNAENPEVTETLIVKHGKENYIKIISSLFSLLSQQKGEDDENRDYDKDENTVKLPRPILNLPRSNAIPKPKPLTKWEKFKQEKGLTQRKRSRMVYSEIAKDWVPRWGKGSAKKIEEEANWVMDDDGTGENPFDKKRQEKNLVKAKQEKRQMKNEMYRLNGGKNNNDMGVNFGGRGKNDKRKNKLQKEINRLDQDKKDLGKRLEEVQKSTRSMGHFDKKLRNEKEINIIKRKRVNKDVLESRKNEKKRDKNIMDSIINQNNK